MSMAAASSEKARRPLGGFLNNPVSGVLILFAFYVLLVAFFVVFTPYFATARNAVSIASNVAFIGMMAAAGTPLIIAGGLDLSVAAVAGLSGVLIALLNAAGWPIWLAVGAAVCMGAGTGFVNGILATALRLNPLIVTLATMSIVGGFALILTGGLTKPVMEPSFNWIGQDRVAGVPVPTILMLTIYLLLAFVLRATHFGRYVYAVGGNPEAARLIGLPVMRVQMVLYVVSALSGAVAGAMLAAMLGAAAPSAASPHLLTVIAAIILGGTSLAGGRGSVWGTLIAVLILGTLNNGLTLNNVSSFWQDVARGVVLVLAVGVDQLRLRLQAH